MNPPDEHRQAHQSQPLGWSSLSENLQSLHRNKGKLNLHPKRYKTLIEHCVNSNVANDAVQ